MYVSTGLTPAARTRTSTCPGPGCGAGTSSRRSTSGGPNSGTRMSFMAQCREKSAGISRRPPSVILPLVELKVAVRAERSDVDGGRFSGEDLRQQRSGDRTEADADHRMARGDRKVP